MSTTPHGQWQAFVSLLTPGVHAGAERFPSRGKGAKIASFHTATQEQQDHDMSPADRLILQCAGESQGRQYSEAGIDMKSHICLVE